MLCIQFVCLNFFLALCRIFLDEEAPDQVLEVTARAITYYLDVSAECTRRIVAVEGAIKAMCNRYVLTYLVLCFHFSEIIKRFMLGEMTKDNL